MAILFTLADPPTLMRRWVIIMLLLVYPFQLALAVADKCCVTTPSGLTHHSAAQGNAALAVEPAFVAEESYGALADPHCPACSFGHSFCLPTEVLVLPPARCQSTVTAFTPPRMTAPPMGRLERPKWATAA